MKNLLIFAYAVLQLVGIASATRTGIAMSANTRVFQQSKAMIIDYMQELFT